MTPCFDTDVIFLNGKNYQQKLSKIVEIFIPHFIHLIKFSRRSSMHLKVVTPLIHYLGEKDSVSSGNHIKMPNFIFQSLISHHRSWRSYSIINFFLRIIHYVKYSKTAKHFRHSPGLMMELVEKLKKVNYLVQTKHYSQFYLNLIKGNFKLIAFKYHCYCAKVSCDLSKVQLQYNTANLKQPLISFWELQCKQLFLKVSGP